MKKKNIVIIDNNENYKANKKFLLLIVLTIFLIFCIVKLVNIKNINEKFAKDAESFYKYNAKTVFSIDKISMYSSANAVRNSVTKPSWDLDIYQYTDIALYINNRDDERLTYENSIKNLYIENIKYTDFKVGQQFLFYKDINYFSKDILNYAKSNDELNRNQIDSKIDYTIINDGDIDYTKPQLYCDASNPITLEFINYNIRKNEVLTDIATDVKYDGSILKRTGIPISDLTGVLSFKVVIINNYNQKFESNVYIEIPLQDNVNGKSIYDGGLVKETKKESIYKFYRTE